MSSTENYDRVEVQLGVQRVAEPVGGQDVPAAVAHVRRRLHCVEDTLVEGSLHARRIRHGLALGATVWTTSYIVLPLARLYRPIWEYDAKVLAKDFADHLVYGLGAASTDRLLPGH